PGRRLDADRDPGRRAPADGLADRLPAGLVAPDLRLFGQIARRVEIEIDLNLARKSDLLRKRADGGRKPFVSQDDRLDVEGEVAQRADRLAMALERIGEHEAGV